MANIKQQKKRILVAQRQRSENLRYRSSIKTAFRRLQEAVQSGDSTAVDAAHGTFVALVDRAAARRALHPNTAARKKARATRVIARGPEVVETKKRRTAPKRTRKAAPKVEETVVEETAADAEVEAEVEEAVADAEVEEIAAEDEVAEAVAEADEAAAEEVADEAASDDKA